MAKVYYVAVQECNGSILIYNNHLDMWGISIDELVSVAEENTPDLFPVCVRSMWDVVNDVLCEKQSEEMISKEMLIMSNPSKVHGAATILYPGSLEQLADSLQSDLFILPSSIHETIILPAKESINSEYLRIMVREVNSTMVIEEEILGDNVYFFDKKLKELKLVG